MEYIRATGKFEIKDVLSWSADKSKKEQTPFIELGLLVDCAGLDKVVRWVGYLSEKAAERTINAILDLGFKGDGPEDFVNGKQDLFPTYEQFLVEFPFLNEIEAPVKYILHLNYLLYFYLDDTLMLAFYKLF
jgi:hypothetical protein